MIVHMQTYQGLEQTLYNLLKLCNTVYLQKSKLCLFNAIIPNFTQAIQLMTVIKQN